MDQFNRPELRMLASLMMEKAATDNPSPRVVEVPGVGRVVPWEDAGLYLVPSVPVDRERYRAARLSAARQRENIRARLRENPLLIATFSRAAIGLYDELEEADLALLAESEAPL